MSITNISGNIERWSFLEEGEMLVLILEIRVLG